MLISRSPWTTKRTAVAVLLGISLGAFAGACATREVPGAFPSEAAASPQAKEAPAARVGVVLAADPPLPGEPAAGWPGLEPPGAQTDQGATGHGHHHHHHGAKPEAAPDKPEADGGAHGGHAH